jgi:uncharacterized membrane protein YfcA
MTGVAAAGCAIVITEDAVALVEKFVAVAMALTVVLVLTVNGAAYFVEEGVGWLPSSV